MRLTFLLILALCVYLSEAGYKDSDEDSGEVKKYKKDKYNKYEKNNKYDKYNKQDKYNKYEKRDDKYNKYEKADKYNKYEKPNDKYNKYEKYQKYDKDDSDESREDDYVDFPPRNSDDRFQKEKYYEQEFNHYKYNKYYDDGRENNKYDDNSRERSKYNKHEKKDNYHKKDNYNKKDKHYQKEDRHYDSHPDSGFFDEAIQFSKRRLFSVPEDDDHFFDDVKHYNQKQQQPQQYNKYQQQQYPSRYPQQNAYHHKQQERREWREPEALQYQENSWSAEKYPGGEGNFKEQGPNTRYHWKQDREDFQRMRPLTIAPPEKRDFVATADMPDPPAPSEAVKMARYIVHNADWTTVATISTLPHIRHYPFVNVLSVSDGPVGKGSGIPYLYMTELDMTPHDLAVNRKCSLSMSLAETDYCKQQSLDPEDPRCAHVTITGEMWKLQNGTQAAQLAEEALFSRHPVMKKWPKDHNFFFATLRIEQIILLDYFGGPKYVDVKEYLRVTLSA